ncbi:hypothetical protein H5410_048219 [Solanum commersonii]|uniref:ATP-dependent DNA helicase n=1 Tax=Solanum commersonii TaxID=4109 RepID=A0A9J5XHG6_SOLCO|nr:hypothetical protein H5410_048219 [Solanum commersonii]
MFFIYASLFAHQSSILLFSILQGEVKDLQLLQLRLQLQYPLLFSYGQNGWHCGIQKVDPLCASFSRQKYCENEQLPSITNMAIIDGFLDVEAEAMQKGKLDYQMPASLRHLFAMLLIYCSPSNPKELWENFEVSLSEDFVRIPNISTNEIRYRVLKHINDILHSVGRVINEFKLIPEIIKASALSKEATNAYFERNITVREGDLLLENKLNIAQRRAYNIILDRIFSNKSGAFFIDGPGETGKSFLYRALLATIRYRGFIALATASSGVVASLLPSIAHSRFKIPINIEGKFSCNISKQSSLASLIQDGMG